MSVGKKVTFSALHAKETLRASLRGGDASHFKLGTMSLNQTGGEVTLFFAPTNEGKKEAMLVVSDGTSEATLPLEGVAEAGTAPAPIETKELLSDPFFYDFSGDRPTSYSVKGTPTKLDDGRRYSSDTGFALMLTTNEEEGYISQKVHFERANRIAEGTELEGCFHYAVDQSQMWPGPLAIRCRWLDKDGTEVTHAEERNLLNNSNLYFGRLKTYGKFVFRTIAPANASSFEFTIAVAPHSQVRFDDFSFRQLALEDCTPFTAILPQFATIYGKTGETKQMEIAMQTMHLGQSTSPEFGGVAGDLKIEGIDAMPPQGTRSGKLLITPSKKGIYKMGTVGSYSVSLSGATEATTLQTTAYISDAQNPPTIAVEGGQEVTLRATPGDSSEKTITLSTSGLIESVSLAVEQEESGIFTINTGQLYYSAKQDKLLVNSFRITFKPKEAKTYYATVHLRSAQAEMVSLKLTGVGLAEGEGWIETFAEDRSLDSRFTGEPWQGYHRFDRGYWKLDGKWLEKGRVELNAGGTLALDEWFFNGLETISIETEGDSPQLSVHYSIDGGGHFSASNPISGQSDWEVKTTRPTRIAITNRSESPIVVKRIIASPSAPEKRTSFSSIEEALQKPQEEALAKLHETFDNLRHTRSLQLKGWQNIPLLGEKPFKAWHQKDVSQSKIEEECAQVSFFAFGKEDNQPHESWLLSPKLSFKRAASKILTFSLRYALPTDNGQEKFGLHIITLHEGVPKVHYIDITKYSPVADVYPEVWYNYYIDLASVEGLAIEDEFMIAFSFYSPIGGNASSLTFMIDDLTFGRDDLPQLSVSQELLTIPFRPGLTSDAKYLEVSTIRATAPIRVLLNAPSKKGHFIVSPQQLPKEGGTIEVKYKSDDADDRAALLLLQTKGAQSKAVKLLATTRTSNNAFVTTQGEVSVFPTITEDFLQLVGEVNRYQIYSLGGEEVQSGFVTANRISLSSLAVGKYILVLVDASNELHTFVVERR